MRLVNFDYLVVENDRLFMESWHFQKSSDHACWRCNFWVAAFFDVYFFTLSFLSYSQPPICIVLI